MAVRDRNLFAWQAYVITMAFLSVGLLLGMFFLWRSYSDLYTRYEEQAAKAKSDQDQFLTSEARVERLLAMLGKGEHTEDELNSMAERFSGDEKLGEVEREFKEQMKLFAANESATDKNLIKLPQYLMQTIRIRNEQVEKAREIENAQEKAMTDLRAEQAEKLKQAEDAQKRAEESLNEARKTHAAQVDSLNSEKEKLLAQYTTYKRDFDAELAKLRADNAKLEAQKKEQAETIAQQIEIIQQYRNPDFASPQGEIIKVANGGTEVWINIGRNDGLRVGVPFSIIDEATVNFSEATPKANMVVTRVIDGGMAVAEVTDYDFRKTIVPGDKVYSPAWRPGSIVGFALVGMLDINGDGKDDADQVRELIRLAGGKIDAEIDSKGNENDQLPGMTPNTSFVVVGTDVSTVGPNDNEELQAQQTQRGTQYKAFLARAQSQGLQTINLDKLMGYLKIEAVDRTVPLGQNIRGDDFRVRPAFTPPR